MSESVDLSVLESSRGRGGGDGLRGGPRPGRARPGRAGPGRAGPGLAGQAPPCDSVGRLSSSASHSTPVHSPH